MHLVSRARKRLLELGLVVDVARAGVLDPLVECVDDRRLDPLESELEVDGRDRGLEHGGKHVPAPRDALELVLRDRAGVVEELLAEPELLRNRRAALPRDDMRTDLREATLRGCAEPVEHRSRDRELENAVAQELEPLVGLGAVLRPGRVREHLREPFGRQLRDEAAELVRPDLVAGLSPDAR